MAETPCQKCKRERDELRARVAELEGKCYSAAGKLATAYTDLNNAEATLRAQAGNHRWRKEAAELRMARENDGKRWKAAVAREHARAEQLEEDLQRARDRIEELEVEVEIAEGG